MDFKELKQRKFSFVYITTKDCNVCKILQPKLRKLAESFPKANFELLELDKYPQAAGEFICFTVPTIIVFSEGKELLRASRNLDLTEIEYKLTKFYNLIF